MNCLSCKTNIVENQSNESLHLHLTEDGNCIEECEDNLFLTSNGVFVSICPNNTYEFSPNNTCLEFCPEDYEKNYELSKCIKKLEFISSNEFKKQIIKNISIYINMTNSSKIINGSDFIALIFTSDNMDPKDQLEKGISAIDLGKCTNVIKEYYNISKDESFYVINIESKNNATEKLEGKTDISFHLGKYTQIEIYDKSNNKLDLSICKQNIKVMKYIGDTKQLNIESAKSFSKQGIDTFNAEDDFFNDIRYDYTNTEGKDIIINDRRTDIYQNATFCQKGCSYSGVNYELKAANCFCNSSFLQSNTNNNQTNSENKNNEEEIVTFKTLTKSFISNLMLFNIDVIKCYNLVFNLKILQKNIGFYCMGLLLLLQITFLFIFLINKLKPLKLFMLKFKKDDSRTANFFPPLKNGKNIKKKRKSFAEDNTNNSEDVFDKNKIELKSDGKENEHILNVINKNLNIQKSKILNVEDVKSNDDSYSFHRLIKEKKEGKLILANNIVSNINIQSAIINVNNQNIENKKMIQYNKNKLYSVNTSEIMGNKTIKKLKNNMETKGEENKNNLNFIKNKNQDLIKLSRDGDNLQEIDYEQAIIYDKRKYFRMYWAFLVETQNILGTFCTKHYLDLFVIKLSFFVFSFQISFFLNAFFYTDEYISDAYHNNGILNFFSGLPKSIYSLVATIVITNILNMLSNSKNELIEVIEKKEKIKIIQI